MKKLCKALALAVLCVMSLALYAGASDFDGIAQELKDVGLFQGTDTGFELDRAPTRAESAVMLVRLLGAEETAKADLEAGKTAHPFTDVPEWAKAHVAWLYTNKLTNGISETEFGSDSLCNAQMYCTFVLRALGYSDGEGGQFAYDEAVSFAAEKGVYNTAVAQGEFLRDDVVAVSYQALFAKVNGQENTLLAKLIADGAVSQTAAQPLLDKQETYAEYVAACAGFEQATGVDMDMTGIMNVTALGAESVAMEISSEIKTLVTDTDVQMEGISTVKAGEEQTETVIKQWIKDGVMYMEADGQKIKMPMDFSDLLAAVQQQTSNVTLANDGLYQIDSITAAESDEGTTYTIVLNGAVNRLLTQMLGQMGDFGEAGLDGMKFDAVSMSVLIDKEGTLKTIGMQFAMTMDMTVEGETTSIAYEYDMDCTINALGDDVVITFPDFTGFEELTQPQPEIGDGETVSDETLEGLVEIGPETAEGETAQAETVDNEAAAA